MSDEIVGRSWNIKCYDKIKITNVFTGQRIHANNFDCRAGSYNQAVGCHKMRDDSDWFVAVRPAQSNISYHFRYNDQILLSSSVAKKYLHISAEHQSQVSKNMEISLCEYGNEQSAEAGDEWVVEAADNVQDDYWRVGEIVRFKNKITEAYLCSHKRKMKENQDYEVYGQKIKSDRLNVANKGESSGRDQSKQQVVKKHEESLWLVSQIVPFIYSATISEQKKVKLTEQAEQLNKLNRTRNSIPRKDIKKKNNETEQILKMQNYRLQQIQNEHKKQLQYEKKMTCWRKYLCCCCYDDDQYTKIK